MIILDTNVISELMREEPDSHVKQWIHFHKAQELTLTVIALAEILRGLARLPKGKKQKTLEQNFMAFVRDAFGGRILSFDEQAAMLYGELAARREQKGLGVDAIDLIIASIAKSHNASIATRNIKDFQGCDLHLINPWNT